MDKLIVSACLCGVKCRYDGSDNAVPGLVRLWKEGRAIAFCPEEGGGLPTPRPPCEIIGGNVIDKNGEDKTSAFEKGGRMMLKLAEEHGAKKAVLKESSPSCGVNFIYDGSFSGKKIEGRGIAAALLHENGIEIISEKEFMEEKLNR
ncbi:MAG: DUF523 domain-containing protein [Christensenellales bacterium]